MQTIGERLEEARKRKGISLREAAEATKIRSDFLSHIEQNQFDFDLPDIYKRGFIGNYARYLKLNPETILTDYQTQRLSSSRLGKKAGAEWFGKMEIQKTESHQDELETGRPPQSFSHPAGMSPDGPDEEDFRSSPESANETTFYIKAGLVLVGTLALVFILFVLVKAILGGPASDRTAITENFSETAVEAPITPANTTGPEPFNASSSITLKASGTVYLLVKQLKDDTQLYRGTLGAGESATFERSGAIDVFFTVGKHLIVENQGEQVRPSVEGTAKITIK